MRVRTRRVVAGGAAAVLLAPAAALTTQGTAVADTKKAECGSTVEAKPGDRILGTTPLLGVPLDLGLVTEATSELTKPIAGLLSRLCTVTVRVVETVVEPAPVIGPPAADAVNNGVTGVTDAAKQALTPNEPAPKNPPGNEPAPEQRPERQPSDQRARNNGGSPGTMPAPNSPVLGGAAPFYATLPSSFATGFAPMRDYSNIPFATAGLYAPSPAVRYGGQIPGYAPDFGVLGEQQRQPAPQRPADGIRDAGEAQALPGTPSGGTDPTGLPVLLAVLALSGATAALVRTWVLRRVIQ